MGTTRSASPRHFSMKYFAAVLVAATLAVVEPANTSAQEDFETTEVADGVYRFRWQAHVGMFVVGDGGVAAFDPISTAAASVYAAEIKRVTDRPLRWIVYSHSDADHTTGATVLAQAFSGQVSIVATEAAVDDISARGDPDQPLPTVTFYRSMTLNLGSTSIGLHDFGPSHSDNMLVAVVPEAGVLFAVDFINNDRVGYQSLPGWHFPGQTRAIRGVLGLDFSTVIYGHGDMGDRDSVYRQLRYYDALERAVGSAIAQGWSEDQAAARIRLPEFAAWGGYDDWFELNVRGAYRAVASGS